MPPSTVIAGYGCSPTPSTSQWRAAHVDGRLGGVPETECGRRELASLDPDGTVHRSGHGAASDMTTVPREPGRAAPQIRPYRIHVPDTDLIELRERLARTRWPDELPGVGWDYGVPLDYLRELAEHWRRTYDWREHEARLNEFAQFTAAIDGETLHFLHVRSPEPAALPLILTYGWPSSIVDFMQVVGPLTNPRAHGADPSDAFHVVVPSLPGYAFSGPTHTTGWNLARITKALAELMHRLGYERYERTGATSAPWSPRRWAGSPRRGLSACTPTAC